MTTNQDTAQQNSTVNMDSPKKNIPIQLLAVGLALGAFIYYCSVGVLDRDPDMAALKIAKSHGGYDPSEVRATAEPSIFPVEHGFLMSMLAEQKMVTFEVHRAGTTGKLHIHLFKWAGFGWKLFQYKDATKK